MPEDDAVRMELGADAWHQSDEHGYYVDCPECGSAATLRNIVDHGRCNGYLDSEMGDTDVDEDADLDCNAELTLELVYESEVESP